MTEPAPGGGRSRSEWFLAPLPGADELPEPAPEELSPEPAGATTVEPARTRARGLALLAGAVALVAGAVVLGDGDEGGNRAGEAIATTTTSRRPATTTTNPLRERPATGPLLPEPTGAALVVVTDSEVLIVELDTGAVRSVAPPTRTPSRAAEVTGPANFPVARVTGDAVIVESPEGLVAVPVTPGKDPVVLEVDGAYSWPVPSDRPGHVWLVSHQEQKLAGREVSAGGQETGRAFDLPAPHGGLPMVAVDGGLVIDTFGSLTLHHPQTGETRAIGHGAPLAGSGDTLAHLSCVALRCSLHLADVRTGADVEVAVPTDRMVLAEPAAFSPDGRWLAVAVGTATEGRNAIALVDVDEGRVVAVHPSVVGYGDTFAFSPDSRWLFVLESSRDVVAHRVGTEETLILERLHPGGAVALAAVALGE